MVKKIVLLSTIGLMTAGLANAGGAQTGVVLGGNLGVSTAQNGFKMDSKHGLAGGLFAGYDYALGRHFSLGVETGAQYATKIAEQSNVSVKTLSVPLFATAKYYIPSMEALNIFGKAGYAYNRLTFDAPGISATASLWRPVAAAGLGYQVGNVNLFAQYQYNWLKSHGINAGQSTYTVGADYKILMGSHAMVPAVAAAAEPVAAIHHASSSVNYVVEKGDTVHHILEDHGVSRANLHTATKCFNKVNNIGNVNLIYPGESFTIPAVSALTSC